MTIAQQVLQHIDTQLELIDEKTAHGLPAEGFDSPVYIPLKAKYLEPRPARRR